MEPTIPSSASSASVSGVVSPEIPSFERPEKHASQAIENTSLPKRMQLHPPNNGDAIRETVKGQGITIHDAL